MDKLEALGFKSYYGQSPSIDAFKGTDINVQSDTDPINVLISDCSDIRHLLKTCADHLHPGVKRENPIHFYLHETEPENLARALLFLTIISETQLTVRERMELFLDIYGNTLIRSRTASYLDEISVEISRLITEHRKGTSVLKDLIDFETLKFKERDEIEDIVNTWRLSIPFDIESMRDQRLRAYFKERYDVRKNLVDWDYHFHLKKFTKFVDREKYIKFRMTGVAFETRLSEGHSANRTMSSYVEGKKKKSGDSCLVRGFWGDIINSPYIPLGIEVMNEDDRSKFNKEYNFQRPYNACDIAEYHVESYATKLETLMDYVAPFEIIKNIENSRNKKNKDESKIEEVKEEDEEEKEEEVKDVKEEKEASKVEEITEAQDTNENTEESKNEEETKDDKVVRDEHKNRRLLEGFKRLNVKIHLMTGKVSTFYQKSKFKNLFNIVVLSMRCTDRLKKEFNELLADGCYIHVENGNNLVIFDEKNKHDFIVKLKEYTKEANWKELPDNYDHHCTFQYIGDDTDIPSYKPIPEFVEDKASISVPPESFNSEASTTEVENSAGEQKSETSSA